MCTAVTDRNLFGRTLDLHCSYGERVVIAPRNYKIEFLQEEVSRSHPAIMGMACVVDGTPLYFDAMNEHGLAVAGLNFPGNAVYHPPQKGKHNITSFEVIPWILCKCKCLSEAVELLKATNITNEDFSPELPSTPLHWIVADTEGAVTVESMADGVKIHDNPFGVLTNNPPFQYHINHVAEYMHLSSEHPKNTLFPEGNLEKYSGGFGAIGLPGDFSSASRFVRAVFAKAHTTREKTAAGNIGRFFHILDTVAVPKGCSKTEENLDNATVYTSCADRSELAYYFTTYNCRAVKSVFMKEHNMDSSRLIIDNNKINAIDF